MIPYGTAAEAEAEAALGRGLTWAEAAWFRYSAAMPDHWLLWHNTLILFLAHVVVPLPLALLERVAPAFAMRYKYKLQPGVRLSQAAVARYFGDTIRVFLLVLVPYQLISYPVVKMAGIRMHGCAVAVGGRDSSAAGSLLLGGGLPLLLDPPLPAHKLGLPQDPPRPPRGHGAHVVRHVLQPLGRGRRLRRPYVRRAHHRTVPHHNALALVCRPYFGGHQHALRVQYDFPFDPTKLIPYHGGAEFHDYHHFVGRQSNSNFSSFFTYCDYIYGTDKGYKYYKANVAKVKAKLARNSTEKEGRNGFSNTKLD